MQLRNSPSRYGAIALGSQRTDHHNPRRALSRIQDALARDDWAASVAWGMKASVMRANTRKWPRQRLW